MSAWNIDPAAVASILTAEQAEVENHLSPAVEGIGTAQETVFGATETEAPLVAAALSEWTSLHEADFTSLANTVSNVLTNTVEAVNAYLQHDEEAALEFQRQAK